MNRFAKLIPLSWSKLSVKLKGGIIISIPATCLFLSLFSLTWLKASLIEDENWVSHTQEVKLETKRLLGALIDAETGVRGYGLTQRNEFLEPYNRAKSIIPDTLDRLEKLVLDNPQQTRKIDIIRELIAENLEIFQQKLTLQQELKRLNAEADPLVPVSDLYDWLGEGKETMDAARSEIARFIETEELLLAERRSHQEFYRQLTWFFLWGAASIGILGSGFAWHLFNQLERELLSRELSLQETNQRLEVACNQLQRFTANASHELRTPLAAILSNVQVGLLELEDLSEPTEDLQKRLQKIVQLTKKMSDLVSELLFLARHEGTANPDSLKAVDLTVLLKTIEAEFSPICQSHQLDFIAAFPDRPIWVKADSSLLERAIANLLNNAIKYTPSPGRVEFHLSSERDRALIQVRDTGIGIPSDSLPHIFERFYRVDSKRSKKSGGFGLGLAITEQIVRAHGGDIEVSSPRERGCCFQITLPTSVISRGGGD